MTSDFRLSGDTSRAFTDRVAPWLNPWNVTVTPVTTPSISGTLMVEGYGDALPLPGRPIEVEFRKLSVAADAPALPKASEPATAASRQTVSVTVIWRVRCMGTRSYGRFEAPSSVPATYVGPAGYLGARP